MKPIIIRFEVEGHTYDLLRIFGNNKKELFVHFLTRNRKEWPTNNNEFKKLPDHVSFHQDGKVHITFKDKTHQDYIKLPHNIFDDATFINRALIAISYRTELLKEFLDHYFVESGNSKEDTQNFTLKLENNVPVTILLFLTEDIDKNLKFVEVKGVFGELEYLADAPEKGMKPLINVLPLPNSESLEKLYQSIQHTKVEN